MFNLHPQSPAHAVFKLADDIRTVRNFSRGMAQIGRETNNDFLRLLFEPIELMDRADDFPTSNVLDVAIKLISRATR